MSNALLRELARRAGIEPGYTDIWKQRHATPEATQRALLHAMGLPCDDRAQVCDSLQRLKARDAPGAPLQQPSRAWLPPALERRGRRWGIAVQLYGLRSARNWGIGDFTDLATLLRGAAALGAAAIGINPLHALFPGRPDHASPYSPSSRHFVNPLYLDVEAIEDFADCDEARAHIASRSFQAKLRVAREATHVDYSAVAALKWPVLRMLYRSFRNRCLAPRRHPRAEAFRTFQREQRQALRRFAIFHALAETQASDDWRSWPEPLQDPESKAVATFAKEYTETIEFHEYLQWQAALQLERVNAAARDAGMSLGLYADLAVGANPAGAEVWSAQRAFARGVSLGAPPDPLNLSGQDWGLPPPDPIVLADSDGAMVADLLGANMRHTGALRIDHILGLMRLYWIPAGAPPDQGAYVRYPWRTLLDVVARESRRHRCLVVGEDLGTVPAGLRSAMRRAGILSYRLLCFEERDGRFPAARDYPARALVAFGTHDLPPLPMWWRGEDIALRERLGLWPSRPRRDDEIKQRKQARLAMLEVLREENLIDGRRTPKAAPVEAAYAYLARTRCKLLMVSFEDVLDQHVQVNVPGTTDEHPNWRARLPCSIDEALGHPRMRRIAAMLHENGRGDA